MKKTLIALSAIAGLAFSAQGATLLTDADIQMGGNTSYNTLGNSFTVAMTLDVAELRTLLEQGQTPAWGTDIISYDSLGNADATTGLTGVTINGTSANNKINSASIYYRWEGTTAWNKNNNGTSQITGGSVLSDLNGAETGTGWDEVAYAGLVYSFGATNGTVVAFTLLDANGDTIVEYFDNSATGLKTGSATTAALTFDESVVSSYYFNQKISNESDLKELAATVATTAAIPEPATASLSLLGLAALMIRRRR